jgi:hypothetical protein
MSLDVLGEYTESLFAHSPCTQKFFPRILHIHQDSLGLYGEGFDEIGVLHLRQNSLFIIHLQQNSLHTFSFCAKILYVHSPYPPKFVMQIRRQIL